MNRPVPGMTGASAMVPSRNDEAMTSSKYSASRKPSVAGDLPTRHIDGRNQHGAAARALGALFGGFERRIVVVDLLRRLEPVADHRHVALDDGAALGAELLRDLLTDLLQHGLFRGAFGDAVEMAAHRADEGDAHHADFKFRRRSVALGDREGVDDEEIDLLVADGLARLLRQLFPDLGRRAAATEG